MRPELRRPTSPRRSLHQRFRPTVGSPSRNSRGRWWPDDGLYPGEPETCRRSWRAFLIVEAHLALLVGVFFTYRLEGRAFQLLSVLAALSLPIHYALPYRWKKTFFLGVSLLGLLLVYGVSTAAVVVPTGAGLILLARLPIPWMLRAGLMAAIAVLLGLVRAGRIPLAIDEAVLPVLASMFMFRMILFLYERKHAEGPESLVDAASYFALLPNFCFLHFPVVDYRAFRRGYFAEHAHVLQHRGLRMMVRGAVQLLCYRIIDHLWLIPADEIVGAADLARFIAGNYLLYLRVSGQFHMACGMLQLFGHQLPPTHNNYLLATGFTDYWRRINIYWKDFMVRVVFNPIVFRFKRAPRFVALSTATAAVFLVTWFLHAYQSFWLLGSWGLSVPDALFWGVLGVLVMINVQLDLRASKPRAARGSRARAIANLAIRALKTAATFVTIAVLWSLWSSPSVAAWFELLRRGLQSD